MKVTSLFSKLIKDEQGGEVLGRIGPREAVFALGRGEDALDEAGVALQRARHPSDLDQVDPNPHPAILC